MSARASAIIDKVYGRRVGKQSRSVKTQDALMDAAQKLISLHGVQSTSMADIAREANLSVGALYHHFEDKRALLFAIVARAIEAHEALHQEAARPELWRELSLREIFAEFLNLSISASRQGEGGKLAVAAILHELPELAPQFLAVQDRTQATLLKFVMARKGEVRGRAKEKRVRFAVRQCLIMLRNHLGETVSQNPKNGQLGDLEFIAECVEMISAYLQLER